MCPSWLPRADFPGATRGSSGLGTTSTFCEPPSPPSASKPVTHCSPSCLGEGGSVPQSSLNLSPKLARGARGGVRPASLCRKALTFAAISLCPCNGSVCSVWERRCPRRVAVILGSLSRSLKFYSARRGSERAARGFAASHRRLLSLGSKTTCKGNSSLSRPFVCCSQKARLHLWVLCAGLWILSFPSHRDMGLSLLAQLPLCPFTLVVSNPSNRNYLLLGKKLCGRWCPRGSSRAVPWRSQGPRAVLAPASHLEIRERREKPVYQQHGRPLQPFPGSRPVCCSPCSCRGISMEECILPPQNTTSNLPVKEKPRLQGFG